MNYFGYKIPEDVTCEICDRPAVDIHHLNGRGKGKDIISNLMALCREHHTEAHRSRVANENCKTIHKELLNIKN